MPMKSSLVSGGITLGVTDLIPTVDWALGGFHGAVPTSASSLVATLIVAGLHAAYNALVARAAAKGRAAVTVPPHAAALLPKEIP